MLSATRIKTLPFIVPAHGRVCSIARLAFFRQIPDVTPVLEFLAFVVCSLDGLEQIVYAVLLCVAFGLIVLLVGGAMIAGCFETVHERGEELAARILKDEHGHDCRYL